MDVKARVSSGDELLNEKFTIPSIITTPNPLDFNTFTTPGIYYVGSHDSTEKHSTNFVNGPVNRWGLLIVSGVNDIAGTPFQIFFTDTLAAIYHRSVNNDEGDPSTWEWKKWTTIIDSTTILDKAFPVGFRYLSADANKSHVPLFGTWSVEEYGTIGAAKPFQPAPPIYQITRTA